MLTKNNYITIAPSGQMMSSVVTRISLFIITEF